MKTLLLNLIVVSIVLVLSSMYVSCTKSQTSTSTTSIVTDSTGTITPGTGTETPEDPKVLMTGILAGLFGVYELVARLVKTKSNISLISFVMAAVTFLLNKIIPNLKVGGGVH